MLLIPREFQEAFEGTATTHLALRWLHGTATLTPDMLRMASD